MTSWRIPACIGRLGACALALAAVPGALRAEDSEIEFGGYVETEVRIFPSSAQFDDQRDATVSPSVAAEPSLTYHWDDRSQYIEFTPFARLDADDHRRSHADIRELHYSYLGNGYDVLIGMHRVSWSIVESRNIQDIINQIDLVEDPIGDEQMGQPMLNVTLYPEFGTLSLFVMSGFRERTFPGDDARYRGPLPISEEDARYDSSMEEWAPDVAARFTRTVGPVDFGLSYFYGTAREPRLQVEIEGPGKAHFVPKYDRIHQPGANIQLTFDALQLRAEAIFRSGQGESFFSAVPGIEYTFFDIVDISGNSVDLSIYSEYIYDGRDDDRNVDSSFFDTSTFLDNDVFGGFRVNFNDENDSLIKAGVAVDVDTGVVLAGVEAETRIVGNLRAAIEARGIFNTSDDDPEDAFSDDSYVGLSLRWYF